MITKKTSISIYDYWEPNSFLKDLYEQQKRQNKRLSYQSVAEKAGIKSTAQLTQIFQGTTKITHKLAPKLALAFGLNKGEFQYFQSLVQYARAKTHKDKTLHFDQLIHLKSLCDKSLDKSQYQYFSKWYYVAIRELLTFYMFDGDYKELAGLLTPKITEAQAKKAINTLEELNLIVQNENGIYESTYAVVKPKEWDKLAISNFQVSTIEMAQEAFDRFLPHERDISTLTFSLSEESLADIKQDIIQFRKKLLEIANKDTHQENGVYQFNVQLFPLAKTNSAQPKQKKVDNGDNAEGQT